MTVVTSNNPSVYVGALVGVYIAFQKPGELYFSLFPECAKIYYSRTLFGFIVAPFVFILYLYIQFSLSLLSFLLFFFGFSSFSLLLFHIFSPK
jgi:hypothetical protein